MASANSKSVKAKPSTPLTVPMREITPTESIACGFRAEVVSCKDGSVCSGGGFGSPWIVIEWKGRHFVIHAVELLSAVVRTFSPEDAALIDGASIGNGIGVEVSTSEE